MPLNDRLSIDLILLVVLLTGCLGICLFIAGNLCKVWTLYRSPWGVDRVCQVTSPSNISQGRNRLTVPQTSCHLCDRVFPHSIHQEICTAFHQNRRSDRIRPVVIVCKPPQGCLQSADSNHYIRICSANALAICNHGTVWTKSGFSAGGIRILAAFSLGSGIMCHHGINIAACHQKCQLGLSKPHDVLGAPPIRLRQHCHGIAL